jgi:hypothetical protein
VVAVVVVLAQLVKQVKVQKAEMVVQAQRPASQAHLSHELVVAVAVQTMV